MVFPSAALYHVIHLFHPINTPFRCLPKRVSTSSPLLVSGRGGGAFRKGGATEFHQPRGGRGGGREEGIGGGIFFVPFPCRFNDAVLRFGRGSSGQVSCKKRPWIRFFFFVRVISVSFSFCCLFAPALFRSTLVALKVTQPAQCHGKGLFDRFNWVCAKRFGFSPGEPLSSLSLFSFFLFSIFKNQDWRGGETQG